jgi:hypothetical protein
MKKEWFQAVDTLEALYFFTQSLEGQALTDVTRMREHYQALPKRGRAQVFKAILKDISALRDLYGAIAPNRYFRELLSEARAQAEKGYVYVSKMEIDSRLFRHYEKVFPRWPHVKEHHLVVFDPKSNRNTRQIFPLEGAMYEDAFALLKLAREAHAGVADFRKRADQQQMKLLAYLRSAAVLVFHFLEAYLNGIAYDCFQIYHNTLPVDDHDQLAEWDSAKKQRRFVAFERKVFRYPVMIGKAKGKVVDLSGCKSAHLLAGQGKELRDALTHPSPYRDPKTGEPRKTTLVAGLRLEFVEPVFAAAKDYVITVEKALGGDPALTVPWLTSG